MTIDPNLVVTIMGALAMIVGVLMMYVPPRASGRDSPDGKAGTFSLFGMRFEAKTPAVIVFLAGVALLGLPFTHPGQAAVKDASRNLGIGPDYAPRFAKPQGYFQEQGSQWKEINTGNGDFATFKLVDDHGAWITLYDDSRDFYVRLPKEGGTAQWSYPNPLVWHDLFIVTPEAKAGG